MLGLPSARLRRDSSTRLHGFAVYNLVSCRGDCAEALPATMDEEEPLLHVRWLARVPGKAGRPSIATTHACGGRRPAPIMRTDTGQPQFGRRHGAAATAAPPTRPLRLQEQDAEVQAPWEYASQLEQGSGSLELTGAAAAPRRRMHSRWCQHPPLPAPGSRSAPPAAPPPPLSRPCSAPAAGVAQGRRAAHAAAPGREQAGRIHGALPPRVCRLPGPPPAHARPHVRPPLRGCAAVCGCVGCASGQSGVHSTRALLASRQLARGGCLCCRPLAAACAGPTAAALPPSCAPAARAPLSLSACGASGWGTPQNPRTNRVGCTTAQGCPCTRSARRTPAVPLHTPRPLPPAPACPSSKTTTLPCPLRALGLRSCCLRAGWSSDVVVEAFVVNVKGAAEPDCHGLIQVGGWARRLVWVCVSWRCDSSGPGCPAAA